MYFITEKDPNYTVKGSRDPLGFQVIWQAAGRCIIPHLSTVSSSIKDFQLLCMAHSLKQTLAISDAEFVPFFLRLEQLFAYTRFQLAPEEGFNGVEKVRKILSQAPRTLKISTTTTEQLLSNQKAYGVWGKYIRPFSDMKIVENTSFQAIYSEKLKGNPTFLAQATKLRKQKEGEVSKVNIEHLEAFFPLLAKPSGAEKELLIQYILPDTCENELLRILSIRDMQAWEALSFYDKLQQLSDSSQHTQFTFALAHISHIEKVLSPLNHIFRYLQTRSFWKVAEIENDAYISNWRTKPDTSGFNDTVKGLANLMQGSNMELVKGLVKRNEEVSLRRNSAPWLQITDLGVEINHFEGGFFWEEYQPERDNDNNYFISSYISLYKQLH